MISPCRSCSLEYVDKNNDTCMRCAKRVKYVAALEGLTCSVPVEMTDMAISNITKEKAKEHDEFILANPDMKAPEIANHLGRSIAAIYNRRHALGLTRKLCTEPGGATIRTQPQLKSAPDAGQAVDVTRSSDIIIVNVNGHEDLYERLKRSAQANFRTPELQAMWFIHQGLAAEDGAGDHRRAPNGTR